MWTKKRLGGGNKSNSFRIIPDVFDGKFFGNDCWSFLTSVFSTVLSCEVCQAFFLT